MAETTILAAGTTAATSTTVTVAAGATVILAMFTASGGMSESAKMDIRADVAAGADVKFYTLTGANPIQVIRNDTTMSLSFNVYRSAQADSVGAISLA